MKAITVYRSFVLILIVASLAASVCGKPGARLLYLNVTMVTGEHSRDSSSTSTSLTVSGDTLVYEQNHYGARANRLPPVKREYKLTATELAALARTLEEKNLLVTRTLLSVPQEGRLNQYFELKIRAKLKGEHLITISGPRSSEKLKEDRIYQNSIYLIEQLYKIINRTDPDLAMPELTKE